MSEHGPSSEAGLLEFFRPECPVCAVTYWYPLVNVLFMAADAFDRGDERFLTPS